MVVENGEGSKTNHSESMVIDDDEDDNNDNDEEDLDDDIQLDELQANKRVKTGRAQTRQSNQTRKSKMEKERKATCGICFQTLDEDLRLYSGHPKDATDEYSIVLHPKLCLFNGNEEDCVQTDFRAFNKVTHFR